MDKKPGIIIQARLTSKRFPNKVLCPLKGKPVVDLVIDACLKTSFPIAVTIPKGKRNVGLLSYLETKYQKLDPPLRIFTGHEEDCLMRFLEANESLKFDPIIRICADSPFLSPNDIQLALKIYNERGYFTRLNHVQVFGRDELEYANQNDTLIASREHVVARFCNHTVDYPEDIDRLTREMEDNSPSMKRRLKFLNEMEN